MNRPTNDDTLPGSPNPKPQQQLISGHDKGEAARLAKARAEVAHDRHEKILKYGPEHFPPTPHKKTFDAENSWQDDYSQDLMVAHLVYWKTLGQQCAAELTADDFKPLGGIPYGQMRWIIADLALDYWSKFHQPPRKLIKRLYLEYADKIGLGQRQIHEMHAYIRELSRLVPKPNPEEARLIGQWVQKYRDKRLKHRAISEIIELQSSNQLTNEKWFEVTEKATCSNEHGFAVSLDTGIGILNRVYHDKDLWLVPNMVPQGFTIFSGPKSEGKTTLAVSLALSVAGGIPFLEHPVVKAGPVFYLSAEDTEMEFQQKLGTVTGGAIFKPELGWKYDRWENALSRIVRLYSDSKGAQIPSMPDFVPFLESMLKRGHIEEDGTRAPYVLCIVDTFWAICAMKSHGRNEVSPKESYREVATLKKLGEKYNVAILLNHHNNKREGGDFRYMISGDTGMTAPVTGLLVYHRHGDERRLIVGGRRLALRNTYDSSHHSRSADATTREGDHGSITVTT